MKEYEVLYHAMGVCYETRRPVCLIGDPGIGKTASVNKFTEQKGVFCLTALASLREPVDFLGVMMEKDGFATYLPLDWVKRLKDNDVLFLDEVTQCMVQVQHALMRVVLERIVGDYSLPNIAVILACNDPDDISGTEMNIALKNRMTHLKWVADTDYLMKKASGNYTEPPRIRPAWADRIPYYEAVVSGFLHRRQDLRNKKPEPTSKDLGWPSSRSWEACARLMAASETLDKDVQEVLMVGTVGLGAGAEYLKYQQEADLPDPEDLLRDPKNAKLPDRTDLQYAVLQSVAGVLAHNFTEGRYLSACTILNKAAKDYAVDIAAVVTKQVIMLGRQHKVMATPDMSAFKAMADLMRS